MTPSDQKALLGYTDWGFPIIVALLTASFIDELRPHSLFVGSIGAVGFALIQFNVTFYRAMNREFQAALSLLEPTRVFKVYVLPYLYINYLFGLSYYCLQKATYQLAKQPYAFNINPASESGSALIDFMHFSFVTATTLGYGDIVPVGIWPKIITILQLILNMFFVVFVFASIVGMYQESVREERERLKADIQEKYKTGTAANGTND